MCFSLWSLKELLIAAVIICAIVALIRVVLAQVPVPGWLAQILNILLWAVVAIVVIVVVFDLIACLLLRVH